MLPVHVITLKPSNTEKHSIQHTHIHTFSFTYTPPHILILSHPHTFTLSLPHNKTHSHTRAHASLFLCYRYCTYTLRPSRKSFFIQSLIHDRCNIHSDMLLNNIVHSNTHTSSRTLTQARPLILTNAHAHSHSSKHKFWKTQPPPPFPLQLPIHLFFRIYNFRM